MSYIKTRILIISDTHGTNDKQNTEHLPACDVAIHCGDLTDGSKLEEYRTIIRYLSSLKAPLKLVIAGNHDFTMDESAFERKSADAAQPLESDLVAKEYGTPGQARGLFEEAKDSGIVFVDEGMHQFILTNGAQLSVYASPYTPSMGQWGFQYHPDKGHNFNIDQGTHIAITHGPPKGILDYTYGRERAGCSDLFSAIANAKPMIHCFGHIHEGWGAKMVTWKEGIENPTHFTAFDNEKSTVLETLAGLRKGKFDSNEDTERKNKKVADLQRRGYRLTTHQADGEFPLISGQNTLFVNAAVESGEEFFQQVPWVVDIDLPRANNKKRSHDNLEGSKTALVHREEKRKKFAEYNSLETI